MFALQTSLTHPPTSAQMNCSGRARRARWDSNLRCSRQVPNQWASYRTPLAAASSSSSSCSSMERARSCRGGGMMCALAAFVYGGFEEDGRFRGFVFECICWRYKTHSNSISVDFDLHWIGPKKMWKVFRFLWDVCAGRVWLRGTCETPWDVLFYFILLKCFVLIKFFLSCFLLQEYHIFLVAKISGTISVFFCNVFFRSNTVVGKFILSVVSLSLSHTQWLYFSLQAIICCCRKCANKLMYQPYRGWEVVQVHFFCGKLYIRYPCRKSLEFLSGHFQCLFSERNWWTEYMESSRACYSFIGNLPSSGFFLDEPLSWESVRLGYSAQWTA